MGNFRQAVADGLRRVKIREALRQVNCTIFVGDAGHAADN